MTNTEFIDQLDLSVQEKLIVTIMGQNLIDFMNVKSVDYVKLNMDVEQIMKLWRYACAFTTQVMESRS